MKSTRDAERRRGRASCRIFIRGRDCGQAGGLEDRRDREAWPSPRKLPRLSREAAGAGSGASWPLMVRDQGEVTATGLSLSSSLHGSVCPSWWTRQEPLLQLQWTGRLDGEGPLETGLGEREQWRQALFFFWRGQTADSGRRIESRPRRHDGRQGGLTASRQG